MKKKSLRLTIKVTFFLTAFCLAATPLFAATLSVGSGEVYSTIQGAVDGAVSGDVIIVDDGTYNENVTVAKSLTIQSANGYTTTVVNVADAALPGFMVTADYVTIEGFTVFGANDPGKAGILLSDVKQCIISDNRCGYEVGKDNYYGVALSGATYCTLENNICDYDDWYGIWVSSLSSNNTISNNHCDGNFVSGILVDGNSNNNKILSNSCSNQFISGISIEGVGNRVQENSCSGNGDGIALLGSEGIVSDNLSSSNNYSGIYANQIENYTIYNNRCSANQTGIMSKGSNTNLIIKNDFNGNLSSNVNSTTSANSWVSPLEIWYGYERSGTPNPPYVRSYMGNYYGDHGFSDGDGDGICDSAYILPGTEPEDDFPLYEMTANYGPDVYCDWDSEVTSSEDLLVLGKLTVVGSLEIAGTLTLGGI